MASPLRTAILATRGFATFFAAAGLTLYAIIMVNLTRSDYPPMLQGLTALPLAGAAVSVLWNLLAFATYRYVSLWHAAGDFLVFVLLSVFGSIGLVHDARTYLSNGLHFEYNQDPWVYEEITGASLLLVSVLLQLTLVFLIFFANRQRKAVAADLSAPPPYYGKNKAEVEVDAKSIASFESYDVILVPKSKATKEKIYKEVEV